VKEVNVYSIFKSKTIRLEQYRFFPQNSFIFVNTTLSLIVFSQGLVVTYKYISFTDLKKIINHCRVQNISKHLLCSANRKRNIEKKNIMREMSHFVGLIRSMTTKKVGKRVSPFLVTVLITCTYYLYDLLVTL
jgi:hypothetical protein